jgi:hypothetical protein
MNKLLPQNVRDIIRDIVRDMNKLLPQKLVLLLYIEKQAYKEILPYIRSNFFRGKLKSA